MQLREYQAELIGRIRLAIMHGRKSIVSVLGCGGGKSVIQAEISRSATVKGNRVLFLVHRKELCEQITGTFSAQGVNMDLCSVSMVQTVSRRLEQIPEPKSIFKVFGQLVENENKFIEKLAKHFKDRSTSECNTFCKVCIT